MQAEGSRAVAEGDRGPGHFRWSPLRPGTRAGESWRATFRVGDVRFAYSDFRVSCGFNNTTSHGGPVREGLHVRIHYVEGIILKFEVAR
jgi:hypothetical protein